MGHSSQCHYKETGEMLETGLQFKLYAKILTSCVVT